MTDFEGYLALMQARPALFENPDAEGLIRVETDAARIRAIEADMRLRLARQGRSPREAEAGIAYEDGYILLLRDAVTFPTGETGTYIRVVSADAQGRGVAILPRWRDRWVLLEHFRHATRRVELEIPRGFGEPDTSPLQNAQRELLEEIGSAAVSLRPLGSVRENTGLSAGEADLFLAEVGSPGALDRAEGISGVVLLSTEELRALIRDNTLRDAYTLAAVCRALVLGWL